VLLVAHRGFALEAPENTLAAVAHAAAAGANAVELDVRAAADGTPVVIHDATVDRVTDATGAVADHLPAELAALSARGSDGDPVGGSDGDPVGGNDGDPVGGSDAGVPTLARALAIASDHGLAVNVELKEPAVARAAVDVIEGSPLPATAVWVSSFHADALQRVSELTVDDGGTVDDGYPGTIDTALLAGSRREEPVATAVDLDCAALHPQYRCVLAGDLVERAHDHGLDVYAWTLDSPWVARVVANAGVDGVIADVALEGFGAPSGARSGDDVAGAADD
jgi:glycerophosphoryl diester phosphodiesterase